MIKLKISDYTGSYSNLNGNKTQNIRPIDLARSLVTMGKDSWDSVFDLGIYRIGELICKAFAFSKIDNGDLILVDKFHSLNPSEKGTISYYFGQGLTKLYAEKHLKIKWLFHLEDYEEFIDFHKKGIALPKKIVGNSIKNAKKPDLIGITSSNNSHILEAKGNSGGYNLSVMQHAINQVSQIKTYNGNNPLTKTACYFDLSQKPIQGIIIDPDGDDGIELKIQEVEVLNKYYNFFKENRKKFTSKFSYKGEDYLTIPVGVPNIYFGFNKRILKLSANDILKNSLYKENWDEERNEDITTYNQVSLGPDGIIIINA